MPTVKLRRMMNRFIDLLHQRNMNYIRIVTKNDTFDELHEN